MGPESANNPILYIDGVRYEGQFREIALSEVTIPKITLPEGTPVPEGMLACLQPLEITMYFKTPKRWRCRSRKRFIKLMMSEGIRRNDAKWLADFVRKMMPYGEAWRYCGLRI